jgi:hypothetical protein
MRNHSTPKLSITIPPRPEPVKVDTNLNCPNPRCTLKVPHVYEDLTPVSPRPINIIRIHLRRFPENANPFPTINCWDLAKEPPVKLKNGDEVYIEGHGVVTLSVRLKDIDGWRLIYCVTEARVIAAVLAVRKKWCADDEEFFGRLKKLLAKSLDNLKR